ncbi:MAG: glucosaminidase domain-containing protein [Bacteroidales bacterium]|nr:glucosaminidase domain-containing protein [Bacteroidales bacterium]MBR6423911.1 glucosaminidase domain-containing protein [Bacteroidales bacterium]
MKRILLLTTLLLCAAMAWGQKLTRAQYIEKYAETAVREMKATGIPASITLAQGCLESGNGNSSLATKANNHFGIKCHNNWKGKTYHQDDDAKNECFRSYKDADESFRDHSDFLRYRDRYAFLFDLEPTDYKGWAYGLKKAGYATAPNYATHLIQIIEENELWRYDQLDPVARQELPPTPVQAEVSRQFKPLPGHKLYQASLSREIRTTNGVPWIRARAGDSYAGLAREYNLFTRELLSFNDCSRKVPLQEGEVVYLEAKKRESAPNLDKHVVEEGETMRQLAQRYAVKMKKLYQYNNLRPGSEPEPGTILLLRKPR